MSKKVGGSDAPAADDGDDDDGAEGLARAARAGRALEALAAKLDREGVFAASSDGAKGLLRLLGGGRPSSEDSDDDENDADDRSGALMRRVSRRRPRDDGGDDDLAERPRASTLRSRADTALTNADAAEAVAAALGAATKAATPRPTRRAAGRGGARGAARAAAGGARGAAARAAAARAPRVLEAAFAASSSRVAIKEPNSKRAADELSALDGKRHQSVAIGLRKLRERKLESGAAVAAALDAETLTEEDVALVRRCALPEAAAADAAELAALKALKPQADAGAGALREGDALAAVLADVDRDDAATLDELYGDLDGDASTARSEADAADDAALRSWAAWLGEQLADLRAARSAATAPRRP
ncbi:7S RNA binding protein [Aureococcus anophagefferens]|nr:7S RNA binding protein [Aureococcus anophagefferens]